MCNVHHARISFLVVKYFQNRHLHMAIYFVLNINIYIYVFGRASNQSAFKLYSMFYTEMLYKLQDIFH